MKVEYSFYADSPSLVIKGADFLKAMKDKDEHLLLEVAVDGFAKKLNVESHFVDEVNEEIKKWVEKTGSVYYTIKGLQTGRSTVDWWCEIFVQNGIRLIDVVISDDGNNFRLNRKDDCHPERK